MIKIMMKPKKGAETIIVWILLIGFTILMTATVFVFEKGKTKEMTESTINWGEARMECNDVAINIGTCVGPGDQQCKATIYNTGRVSIYGIVYRDDNGKKKEYGVHTGDTVNFPMKPGSSPLTPMIMNTGDWTFVNGLDVIPLVGVEGRVYACDKKIIRALPESLCNCQEQ